MDFRSTIENQNKKMELPPYKKVFYLNNIDVRTKFHILFNCQRFPNGDRLAQVHYLLLPGIYRDKIEKYYFGGIPYNRERIKDTIKELVFIVATRNVKWT